MNAEPPFPGYSPKDRDSFSYETVVKRWPVIITGLIDNIYRANHKFFMEGDASENQDSKISEGKGLIEKLSELRYDMGRDRPLNLIQGDQGLDVAIYNQGLESLVARGLNTWFTAPWLYAECYLYRLIRSWFASTQHWKQYDPFEEQKTSTFQASGKAVYQLAITMSEIEATSAIPETQLHVLFDEMIQMCLWGNATDLSLLPSMEYRDIQALQSVGRAAQAASAEYILRNDLKQLWEHVRCLKDARVDIVLDNAGFELFTDLILADFLVTHTPYVSSVVFHPKLLPWFVSDVVPTDFANQLASIDWKTYFAPSYPSPSHQEILALRSMMDRWRTYAQRGVFRLFVDQDTRLGIPLKGEGSELVESTSFWTLPYSYWKLPEQAYLIGELEKSGLVIFKGDLNYRKLTADVKWPPSTPFSEAIGPLRGRISVLSLRTCKADVVVGLDEGVGEKLDADETAKGWRVNGKYGLITYEGRAIEVDKE